MSGPVREILHRLEGVKRSGSRWMACCPAHDDRNPSLSVHEGRDGRVLLNCFHGCSFRAILKALGLSPRDLMAERPAFERINPNYFHRTATPTRSGHARKADPAKPAIDWERVATNFRQRIRKADLLRLADLLGVSLDALIRLDVGCAGGGYWSFPHRDASGAIIGIRLRREQDGNKRMVTGSSLGLVIPNNLRTCDPLLITEGETDCAAALTMDFDAVARPGCATTTALLVAFLKCRTIANVVIVADADAPGRNGARTLAKELAKRIEHIRTIEPKGAKDLRAWLRAGARRLDVERLIDLAPPNTRWENSAIDYVKGSAR